MPTVIDKTVDGLPFPTVLPIIWAHNYKKISEVHLKLNSNAASVQSNLGCVTLGLLHPTLSLAVSSSLSATDLIYAVNPGTDPTIPSIVSGP